MATVKRRTGKKVATAGTETDSNEKKVPQAKPEEVNWKWEAIFLSIILVVTVTKLLYRLGLPANIVWDETHFTKFSTWYFTGHYYVDIHPPLAKIFMAILIYLSGYQALNESNVEWWTATGFVGTQDYVNIYNSSTFYWVRLGSLTAGTILVVAAYTSLRVLGCKRITSFFGAWLVMMDHMITVDSRLILTDVYLWMFHVITIACTFQSSKAKTPFEIVVWYILTGFSLGCAVSVKYTAFGTIGFVGIHQLVHVFYSLYNAIYVNSTLPKNKRKEISFIVSEHFLTALWKAVTILSVAFVVFFIVWQAHAFLLPYDGQGNGFMTDEFNYSLTPFFTDEEIAQAELGGCPNHANSWHDCGFPTITKEQCLARGCCWDETSVDKWCYPSTRPELLDPIPISPWRSFYLMLSATWSNNQGEELAYHPQMSRWWQWPLLLCKFVDFGGGIYSMGNPVVWYLIAFVMALIVLIICGNIPIELSNLMIAPPKKSESVFYAGGLPAYFVFFIFMIGYLGNWAPFYFIERSTWNYHYALALLVGMLSVGFTFDFLLRYYEKKSVIVYRIVYGSMIFLMVLMSIAFWYWSPWVYGFKISAAEKLALRWYHLWGI